MGFYPILILEWALCSIRKRDGQKSMDISSLPLRAVNGIRQLSWLCTLQELKIYVYLDNSSTFPGKNCISLAAGDGLLALLEELIDLGSTKLDTDRFRG